MVGSCEILTTKGFQKCRCVCACEAILLIVCRHHNRCWLFEFCSKDSHFIEEFFEAINSWHTIVLTNIQTTIYADTQQ